MVGVWALLCYVLFCVVDGLFCVAVFIVLLVCDALCVLVCLRCCVV